MQAGNSESIIHKHYLDLKGPAEAEQFFSILPSRMAVATEQGNDAVSPVPIPFVAA